jgi:hypothetical protein
MSLTIWQQNAVAFATRPESAIDAERRVSRQRALKLIGEGRPGYALFVLARSVERQNRIAGGGTVPVEPLCACGGRCEHGQAVR